jgi:creatinine amidohydrolase
MREWTTFKWQELSGPEVAALAQETQVAILPIGCIEMHGPHLPTGTDGFQAEGIAEMIAKREPAIILPTLFYNINDEMTCYPGTISISPELMARLYEELCCEAARNGFTRIVLLIGHGGSQDVTQFVHHSFLQRRLQEKLGFAVFDISFVRFAGQADVLESGPDQQGHACEVETSLIQYFRPELVHLDRLTPLPDGEGPYYPKTIEYGWYTIDWIRQVPSGYVGLPHLASRAKGADLAEIITGECARVVRQIKEYDPSRDR